MNFILNNTFLTNIIWYTLLRLEYGTYVCSPLHLNVQKCGIQYKLWAEIITLNIWMCNKLSVKFRSQICGRKILGEQLKPSQKEILSQGYSHYLCAFTSEAWEVCAHVIHDCEGVTWGAGLIVGCSSWGPTKNPKIAKFAPFAPICTNLLQYHPETVFIYSL